MAFKIKAFAISFGITTALCVVFMLATCGRNGNDIPYTDVVFEAQQPLAMAQEQISLTPLEDNLLEEVYDEEYYEEEYIELAPVSVLTGMPINEEYITRRPFAVVINNIRRALPQSGIASADIIYEALAEGDVTRFVAIFQSYVPNKIGPVRSTRDYFVDFALNHDSIFVHHGGSDSGYARVRNTGIPALDGMALEGSVFWRDRAYPSWSFNTGTRPLEHSSYTGWQRIYPHIASRDIRDYMRDDISYGFLFGDIPEGIENLGEANSVSVPFVAGDVRTFVFDPEHGHYLVQNRDGAHVDELNREQVVVSNILVQLVPIRVVDGVGRRNIYTVGEGSGYLIRDGTYFAVNWAKSSHTSPMRWYFEDGSPIILTPGSTWICVFQSTGTVGFE